VLPLQFHSPSRTEHGEWHASLEIESRNLFRLLGEDWDRLQHLYEGLPLQSCEDISPQADRVVHYKKQVCKTPFFIHGRCFLWKETKSQAGSAVVGIHMMSHVQKCWHGPSLVQKSLLSGHGHFSPFDS
jgi:hypothetical protein